MGQTNSDAMGRDNDFKGYNLVLLHSDSGSYSYIHLINGKLLVYGNAHIIGHVKLGFGTNGIKCDSAIIEDNELIAYNARILNLDSPLMEIKGDLLKLDLISNDGLFNGNLFFYTRENNIPIWTKRSIDFTDSTFVLNSLTK